MTVKLLLFFLLDFNSTHKKIGKTKDPLILLQLAVRQSDHQDLKLNKSTQFLIFLPYFRTMPRSKHKLMSVATIIDWMRKVSE